MAGLQICYEIYQGLNKVFCGSLRRPRINYPPRATVAQSVEHLTRNEDVRGSIPRGGSSYSDQPIRLLPIQEQGFISLIAGRLGPLTEGSSAARLADKLRPVKLCIEKRSGIWYG